MRFFYLIIIIILLVLSIIFALFNMEQTVSIQFFKWTYPVLPLVGYLYLFFFIGLLVGLGISGFEFFKLKKEAHRLTKENKKIKSELDKMRNASIEEDVDQSDVDSNEAKTIVE